MRPSLSVRMLTACCLLILCSCSRREGDEIIKLKAELEAARADAVNAQKDLAAARMELAKLKGISNAAAKANDSVTEKSVRRKGSGEMKFASGKTRRFTGLVGVQGTQSGQSWTYQKLPGELFFSTIDQRQILIPIDKITSVKLTETDNNANPEAEVVPVTGAKQVFRFWILNSLADVTWEGALGAERMHLHGGLTISFDK